MENFYELIEQIKKHINSEYINTNNLQAYLSFNAKQPSSEERLDMINREYLKLQKTKDGHLIEPHDVIEILEEIIEENEPELDFFIQNGPGRNELSKIQSMLETTLIKFNLENNNFQTLSSLQVLLMDYRNQKGTSYCDSEFFDNARKAFNAVPDEMDGYPSKNEINEFCKTAYLNHFIELNPFDSDADLSIEEFKCVFGDLTGFIQSQNEKELINRSIQSSEAPIRKRRL